MKKLCTLDYDNFTKLMPRYIYITFFIVFCFVLNISAQDKYELKSISFNGNNYFSSSTLSDVIPSKPSPMWFLKFLHSFTSFGQPPIYFDSTNISADIKALSSFYNNNGFFKAKISYLIEKNLEEKQVDLIFQIDEGEPATYGSVKTTGLSSVFSPLREDLNASLMMDSTKVFDESIIKEKNDASILSLENNGYMSAKFDSTVVVKDTLQNKAHLNTFFNTGKRYLINRIIIDKKGPGSDYVEDQLLKDIVGISDSDYYSLEQLRQSQVRLFRTGLFSTVMIVPKVEDTVRNLVPIKIVGNIGLLNELSPEIIINNQQNSFTLGGGGGYIRKNFLGHARKLSISGMAGVKDIFRTNVWSILNRFTLSDTTLQGYIEATLKIEQPYVFNRPIFGILESYLKIEKDRISDRKSYGGKISFEFEMPSYTFVSALTAYYNLEIAYESYFLHRISPTAWPLPDSRLTNSSVLSTIGVDIKSSKNDNPLFPTRGYNLSINFEETNGIPQILSNLSVLKSDDPSFYKGLITFASYLSLGNNKNTIIAQKFKVGYLQAYYGESRDIPSARKFFGGGSNSIRGWRSLELGPVQVFNNQLDSLVNNSYIYSGGNMLLEGSTELRQRFLENFGISIFLDYGNAFEGYSNVSLNQIAVTSGIGFRYYTAIAPFRIDFGFKAYDPYDNTPFFRRKLFDVMEFHFGIGEAF